MAPQHSIIDQEFFETLQKILRVHGIQRAISYLSRKKGYGDPESIFLLGHRELSWGFGERFEECDLGRLIGIAHGIVVFQPPSLNFIKVCGLVKRGPHPDDALFVARLLLPGDQSFFKICLPDQLDMDKMIDDCPIVVKCHADACAAFAYGIHRDRWQFMQRWFNRWLPIV